MRRLLLALGLFGGLISAALAVVQATGVGNAAYTILITDQRLYTTTTFTVSRTWTLPPAAATCLGQTCSSNALEIYDVASAFSVASPLILAPQSGETINGSTSSLTIPNAGARVIAFPVNGSAWLVQVSQSAGSGIGTLPTVFHSGGQSAVAVGTGTDATAVNTETYIVEVFVPITTTLTGIKWLGLASSTGNVQFSLADSTGAVIAAAQSASTATAATANYQTAAFAATYLAKGPAKYFVLMQNSGSNHYRAHAVGNFGASKKTGETYGTFTAVTAPTTFTADIAPILDVY